MTRTTILPTFADVERARHIVLRFGWNVTAYQILNPGISLWFSQRFDAVVGYVTHNGYRIIAGAPVCAKENLREVVNEFEADTRSHHLRTCYFCAGNRLASIISADKPLNYILLGAQPVWRPSALRKIIHEKPSLRAQLARARNKGIQVAVWDNLRASNNSELESCLQEWLKTRGLPPLHFLIESQTLAMLGDRKIFVAERANRVVGFLLLSPIPNRNGWLVEQNVRGLDAPNGTIELLLANAAQHLEDIGAEYLTMGLSPLSRRAYFSPNHPVWLEGILTFLREYGRSFYNFDGLDAFKAKFMPEFWEPIYAITSEKSVSLRTLYAIAGAFGGMSPIRLILTAVYRSFGIKFRSFM